jgi:hypothetical protein
MVLKNEVFDAMLVLVHMATHLRMYASIIKRIHESRGVYNELEVPYQTRNNSLNYALRHICQVLRSSSNNSSQQWQQ